MTLIALSALALSRRVRPVRPAHFNAAMDAALSLALRSTRRAIRSARRALDVATYLDRPDLASEANHLLGTLESL